MSAAAAAVQESIQSFSCPPNIAVEPLALLAITLQDNTEQRLHVICCSIIRTDRWCSGGEAGRGIAVCSHILTTDSTSPLSPWLERRYVMLPSASRAGRPGLARWLRNIPTNPLHHVILHFSCPFSHTAARPASLPACCAWLNLSQSWDYPRGLLVLLLWMWLIAFQRATEFISLNVRLRSDALEAAGHRRLTTLTFLNQPMATQTCISLSFDLFFKGTHCCFVIIVSLF